MNDHRIVSGVLSCNLSWDFKIELHRLNRKTVCHIKQSFSRQFEACLENQLTWCLADKLEQIQSLK